jgi:hypothetical protein
MKKQMTSVVLALGLAMVPTAALAETRTTTLAGSYNTAGGPYRQMALGAGPTTWTFNSWTASGYLTFTRCFETTPAYSFPVPAGATTFTTDIVGQWSCYYVSVRSAGGTGMLDASFTYKVYGT